MGKEAIPRKKRIGGQTPGGGLKKKKKEKRPRKGVGLCIRGADKASDVGKWWKLKKSLAKGKKGGSGKEKPIGSEVTEKEYRPSRPRTADGEGGDGGLLGFFWGKGKTRTARTEEETGGSGRCQGFTHTGVRLKEQKKKSRWKSKKGGTRDR